MLKNKKDIKAWLEKYQIDKYTINDNFTVDVEGDVNLNKCHLTAIPVQFDKVDGLFLCGNNQLTSLQGCPQVVWDNFDCSNNLLTSLEGGPIRVSNAYFCNNNQLTSLKGCPEGTVTYFNCNNNKIESLSNSPKCVTIAFECANNPIKNLDDFNSDLKGMFHHAMSIIEPLGEYYKLNKQNILELSLPYKEVKSIILHDKLNNNLDNKLEQKTKKMKI